MIKQKDGEPKRDKTLRKGLKLIEILSRSGSQNLRDIASKADLTRANTHQLLRTLIEEGYIYQDEKTAQYGTTLKVWEIGQSQVDSVALVKPLAPLMRALRDEVKETINLAILDHTEVLYLHKEDSNRGVGSFTQIGARAPAHCVATGKAMIAFNPKGEAFWRTFTLDAFNTETITDMEAFVQEMKATHARGYSTTSNEWRGEVRACAAPILGFNGNVRAAVGISGPHNRMSSQRVAELGKRLCEFTKSVFRQLEGRS